MYLLPYIAHTTVAQQITSSEMTESPKRTDTETGQVPEIEPQQEPSNDDEIAKESTKSPMSYGDGEVEEEQGLVVTNDDEIVNEAIAANGGEDEEDKQGPPPSDDGIAKAAGAPKPISPEDISEIYNEEPPSKKPKLEDTNSDDEEKPSSTVASEDTVEEARGETSPHQRGIQQRLMVLLGQTLASPPASDKSSCEEEEDPVADDSGPPSMADTTGISKEDTVDGASVEKETAVDETSSDIPPKETGEAINDDNSEHKPPADAKASPPPGGTKDSKEDALDGASVEKETDVDEPSSGIPKKDSGAATNDGNSGQEPSTVAKANLPSATGDAGPEEIAKVKLILEQRRKAEEDNDTFMDGWYNWVNDLLDYHQKHGHCQVRDAESHALYNWLKRQRVMFRKGKLEPEKLKILQLLKTNGFETLQDKNSKISAKAALVAGPNSKHQQSTKATNEKQREAAERARQRALSTNRNMNLSRAVASAGGGGTGMGVPPSRPTEQGRLSSDMSRLLGLPYGRHDAPRQLSVPQAQRRMTPQDAPGAVLEAGREEEEEGGAMRLASLLPSHQVAASLLNFGGAQDPNSVEMARNQQALLLLIQQQQAQQRAQQQQRQQDLLILHQLLQQRYSRPPPRGDP